MAAILPPRCPAHKHRGRSPWRPPYQPRIEILEDRTLLSGDLNQLFIAQVYRDLHDTQASSNEFAEFERLSKLQQEKGPERESLAGTEGK